MIQLHTMSGEGQSVGWLHHVAVRETLMGAQLVVETCPKTGGNSAMIAFYVAEPTAPR